LGVLYLQSNYTANGLIFQDYEREGDAKLFRMIAITGQPCLKGANDVCFRHEKPCLVMIEKGFSNYQPDVEIGILSQKTPPPKLYGWRCFLCLKLPESVKLNRQKQNHFIIP